MTALCLTLAVALIVGERCMDAHDEWTESKETR